MYMIICTYIHADLLLLLVSILYVVACLLVVFFFGSASNVVSMRPLFSRVSLLLMCEIVF